MCEAVARQQEHALLAITQAGNKLLDKTPFLWYIILMNETYNDPSDSTRVRERCEDAPCCGCCGPDTVGGYDSQPYGGFEGQWAGDGSGLDDLADFNAMEGDDY